MIISGPGGIALCKSEAWPRCDLPVSELHVAADRVVVGLGLAEVGDDERETNVVERRTGDHLAADEVGVPGRRRG